MKWLWVSFIARCSVSEAYQVTGYISIKRSLYYSITLSKRAVTDCSIRVFIVEYHDSPDAVLYYDTYV